MIDSRTEMIAGQYTKIVGSLDTLFSEMDLRSGMSWWRYDNAGSCAQIEGYLVDAEVKGPVGNYLLQLRTKVRAHELQQNPMLEFWQSALSPSDCSYFTERGCMLGRLKQPTCISFVEGKGAVRDTFGINGDELQSDIKTLLNTVLKQEPMQLGKDFVSVDECVELGLDAIEQMRNHVKTFPKIY